MRVGIVSNIPYPDNDVFAREQALAFAGLGHDVTVFAPPSANGAWPTPASTAHVPLSWQRQPEAFLSALTDVAPDAVHAYQARGIRRALPRARPTFIEITSTSLRPPLLRHLALLATTLEVRGIRTGTANRRLIGAMRPADFYAPNGYSSWALQAFESRQHGGVDAHRFLYQGSLSALRKLDLLLEAFVIVVQEHPDAQLEVIGSEPVDELTDTARRLDVLDNLVIERSAGPETLAMAHARCAIAMSWIPHSTGFAHQPPLKILDAQASGVPVLATDTPASLEILAYGGGRSAPFEPGAFAEAWLEMVDDLETGKTFPLVDRERFVLERSWTTIMSEYWLPRYRERVDTDD